MTSYIFYGWWDYRFLILIFITSLCSYSSGIMQSGGRKYKKFICITNISINLLILGVFKYYNFFMENFEDLFRLFGYQMDWGSLQFILPVGISFYTFQALSYTIDVYKGKIVPTYDIIEFFAYISFFPQLVAGPIERATNLLPQFQKKRIFDYSQAVDGLRQMLWGFLKKLVIADNCATVVNNYWNNYSELFGLQLFAIAVLFTFQIYCDFSGYSDIAIGCARLFGIKLMRNFNYPYFSINIQDFWRRWHISLTSWFRDYIYIQLGGNRCTKWKVVRNIVIVFAVSGLWHGANWTFVCWGLFHATLLVIYYFLKNKTKNDQSFSQRRFLTPLMKSLQISFTFLLIVIGWIIFRSGSMTQAYEFIYRMIITLLDNPHIIYGKTYLLYGFILLFVEWLQRGKQHALQFPNIMPFHYRWIRWMIYYVIILIIAQNAGRSQDFIYFQF